MSCPFLSTRNTTFAFASLVNRSQTALILVNSSSYITNCVPMGVYAPKRSLDLYFRGPRGFPVGFRNEFRRLGAALPTGGALAKPFQPGKKPPHGVAAGAPGAGV